MFFIYSQLTNKMCFNFLRSSLCWIFFFIFSKGCNQIILLSLTQNILYFTPWKKKGLTYKLHYWDKLYYSKLKKVLVDKKSSHLKL